MTTEPFRPILDPEFSIIGSKDLIELAAPLLREVVNHATHAFQRCQSCTKDMGEVDEDIAPFQLYGLVIEMTDAAEVLIRACCGRACIPLARTSFEATLGLKYLTRENTRQRSLHWFCAHFIDQLAAYRSFDPGDPSSGKFNAAWEKSYGTRFPSPPNLGLAIDNLVSLLGKPHLAPIVAEYERLKASRRRTPSWYSLFGGPENLRELAKSLNREAEYNLLYHQWSAVSHAQQVTGLTRKKDGSPAVKSLRYPGEIKHIAQFMAHFQFTATLLMVNRYRPGEKLTKWYLEEYKPRRERLAGTEFKIEALEI